MKTVKATHLNVGDVIVNGGTIIGPSLRRDIPLHRDAIASFEVGFPIRYSNGGEAVRIFNKDADVQIEETE